jgi:phosphopantetheine--protein transferase-like protein
MQYHRGLCSSSSSTTNTNQDNPFSVVFQANLCGANCVAIQCPTAGQFTFNGTNGDIVKQITRAASGVLRSFGAADREAMRTELNFGSAKEQQKDARVNIFMGGRLALRRAIFETSQNVPHLSATGLTDSQTVVDAAATTPEVHALLSNGLGAPLLPPGITGSISHKEQVAVAVALRVGAGMARQGHIGVDIEKCSNKAHDKLKRRLFTHAEQTSIDANEVGAYTPEEDVMLRFSFKEAIYKALSPYLRRYVEFTQVEVHPRRDGTAEVVFRLKTGERFEYRAEWRRFQDRYWITCVHIWEPTL